MLSHILNMFCFSLLNKSLANIPRRLIELRGLKAKDENQTHINIWGNIIMSSDKTKLFHRTMYLPLQKENIYIYWRPYIS